MNIYENITGVLSGASRAYRKNYRDSQVNWKDVVRTKGKGDPSHNNFVDKYNNSLKKYAKALKVIPRNPNRDQKRLTSTFQNSIVRNRIARRFPGNRP